MTVARIAAPRLHPRPAVRSEPLPLATAGRPRNRAASAFAVVVFVHATNAGFAVLGARPAAQVLWLALYAIAAAALADSVLRHRETVPWSWPVVALVALVVASVTSSVAPVVTVESVVNLLGTVVLGLLLAQRLRPVQLLDALWCAMAVVALASLAFLATGDGRALDSAHGTLRGVLVAKNSLGGAMAFGLVAAALSAHLTPRGWWLRTVASVPMLAALALTDSAGGLTVTVMGLALVGAARLGLRRPRALAVLFALALPIVALAGFGPSAVSGSDLTGLVGRDTTLTSRTDIWALSLEAVRGNPWLGYGYGAFWDASGTAAHIRQDLSFQVAHAHNGFLDVALGLGLLGVAVAVWLLVDLTLAGLRDLRAGLTKRGVVRVAVVLLALGSTAVESGLLSDRSGLTVLLVALSASPGRAALVAARPYVGPLRPQCTAVPR